MARLKLSPRDVKRAITLSTWLFSIFLHAYPAPFGRMYGSRMTRVFRDSCRNALQRRGLAGLILLWLSTLSDLVRTAYLERWQVFKEEAHSMALDTHFQNFSLRLWIALAVTVVAFTVSLVASLNLYLLEDTSNLTQAAYSASPLLRFSYDGIYLSTLAAGVAACAIVGYVLVQRESVVIVSLIVVALLVAFGGFGGLLAHHFITFLVFVTVFFALIVISFLCGRAVATHASRRLDHRPAAVMGACVSVGILLLVNVAALILHTLLLNPISHALYMQGQIGGTLLNFSLIAMGLAFLSMIACILSLGNVEK